MSIYDINGQTISDAYDVDGQSLDYAYDVEGEEVFRKAPLSLKLMTYNVGQWYLGNHDNVPSSLDAEYYALQNGMIQSQDADILFLEEYTLQFSKTGRTALSLLQQYYPYIHERGISNPSSSSGAYCCLCSKYPISNYVHHNFADGYGMYYDTCTITIGNIEVFAVITHFYWVMNSEAATAVRVAEAQQILNAISGKQYVILAGDFNTFDFFSTSSADYAVMKVFLDAGYSIANGGAFGFLRTWTDQTTATDMLCLDNIVVTPNITFDDVYTDTTKLTDSIVEKVDHIPLVAEVTIS